MYVSLAVQERSVGQREILGSSQCVVFKTILDETPRIGWR